MSEDSKKMQELIETAKTVTEDLNALNNYKNCVPSERAEQLQLQGAAALGALTGGALGGAVTLPVRFIPVVGNPLANVFTATAAIVQADKAVKAAREDIAAHNMACAEAAANTVTLKPTMDKPIGNAQGVPQPAFDPLGIFNPKKDTTFDPLGIFAPRSATVEPVVKSTTAADRESRTAR